MEMKYNNKCNLSLNMAGIHLLNKNVDKQVLFGLKHQFKSCRKLLYMCHLLQVHHRDEAC